MSNEEIDRNPNFKRGMYTLWAQFDTVNDMVRYWKAAGPAKRGPWPERRDPWFQNLPTTWETP